MHTRYSIYALINPISNEMFYVGCTEQSILLRLEHHCCGHSNPKNPRGWKSEKIIEILESGHKPLVKEIDYAYGHKEALDREKFWIFELAKDGNPILNREVRKQKKFEVYFTTNFPYGVSVGVGDPIPTSILMYGKHKNRREPEYEVDKNNPNYLEVHDNDYSSEMIKKLLRLRENVYPFLRKPLADADVFE